METDEHKKLDLSLLGEFLGCPEYSYRDKDEIKKYAEEAFVVLAPITGAPILDRSYLSDHQSEFFRLPKRERDYLTDIFLTVKIPGYEHQEAEIPSANEESPGPSNPVTTPQSRRNTKLLSQIFQSIHMLEAEMQSLVCEELLNSFGANDFEKELFHCFRIFWMQDQLVLKEILDKATVDPLAAKLINLLNPKEGEKKIVNELLVLWILTSPNMRRYYQLWGFRSQIKEHLQAFFNQQFAAWVPETSAFFLINRSYYVENRIAIEALPEEAQTLIQRCLITASTIGHEEHKDEIIYPEGFFITHVKTSIERDPVSSGSSMRDRLIHVFGHSGIKTRLIPELVISESKDALIGAMISSGLKKETISEVSKSGSQKEIISALMASAKRKSYSKK